MKLEFLIFWLHQNPSVHPTKADAEVEMLITQIPCKEDGGKMHIVIHVNDCKKYDFIRINADISI